MDNERCTKKSKTKTKNKKKKSRKEKRRKERDEEERGKQLRESLKRRGKDERQVRHNSNSIAFALFGCISRVKNAHTPWAILLTTSYS